MTTKIVFTALGMVCTALSAQASTFVLQPDEAASKDVFVYEFEIPDTLGVPFSPNENNFDTETLAAIDPPPAVPFGTVLGAADTDPFELASAPGIFRAHDTRSLIEFDLSGIGIGADRVASASLVLFQAPGLPPFEDPTVANPVTTNLRPVLEAWDEQAVTWENQPLAGPILDQITVSGVGQFVSFDVTSLVMSWLDGTAANYGVQISQDAVVSIPASDPADPDGVRFAASVFASSAFADPSVRPSLVVSEVPVPASALLLGAALAGLGGLRRRR